ncbi:MerR family transcriptional regulator [Apilactobacillus kunkeei]|uniref:MerR family transcriptional regulator n=1 Tax=Apilactobacillus kunkeei TaxID=148814 RepID=A0A0M9DGL5_9LACO|nr:MerR family transcriptional regulator [Apilactobacillus kunkeei]KOY79766.1 MerR family transcriptional regulator [Apilactobacillus kunkeei]
MNIDEVSKQMDVSKQTLRYWERIGLLQPIKRNSSGYREYSERDLNWVHYIKALRNAGMSISRLTSFVSIYMADHDDINKRRSLLVEQRQELFDQIKKQQETIEYLSYKIDYFDKYMKEKQGDRKHGK